MPECDAKLYSSGVCRKHYKQQHPTRYEVACITCGESFRSSRRDGKFCTDECKGAHYATIKPLTCKLPTDHPVTKNIRAMRDAANAEEARQQARRRAERKALHLLSWRTARACVACDAEFCPLYTSNQNTCSPRCSKIVGRRDRRVRRHGAYVEPVNWRIVAKRDGMACHLCGYDTNQNDYDYRVGSDGRQAFIAGLEYPTLDHVVALANGGTHALTNARLAHHYCNAIKGAQPLDAVA